MAYEKSHFTEVTLQSNVQELSMKFFLVIDPTNVQSITKDQSCLKGSIQLKDFCYRTTSRDYKQVSQKAKYPNPSLML